MASYHGELDLLASRTRHILTGFDGPICEIFADPPSHVVANELRRELEDVQIDIPPDVATTDDPLEVFLAVANREDGSGGIAQAFLTALEVRAVQTARPALGSADLLGEAAQTGRTVIVVTNNSPTAVKAYLNGNIWTRI